VPNEVEIVVKSRDDSKAGIDSARSGTRKLAKDLDDTDKASRRASAGVGGVRGVIKDLVPTASVAAAAVGAFGLKTAFMASDLNETLSKSKVIFGQGAAEIEKWGATAARAFGLSQQEAVANASSLGDMFSQMGVGAGETLKMSKGIVELAGDLASFHNADPTDVIEAQTAAFRGEYDSLQRFVPTINAAAVQTEALAASGKTNADQLTAAEKATAAYTLMLRGTTAAQGDFARTSDGAANQARILAAEAKDAAAQVGGALQPALKGAITAGRGAVGVIGDLAEGAAALPGPVKSGAAGLLTVAVAAKAASVAIPAVIDKTKDMAASFRAVKAGSLIAGGALAVLGIAAGALIGHLEQGKQKARDFIDTLLDTSGADTAKQKLEALGRALSDEASLSKMSGEERLQAIIAYKALERQVGNESRAKEINTETTEGNAKAHAEATGQVKDERTAVEKLVDSIDKLNKTTTDAAEGNLDFLDALDGVKSSIEENGRGFGTLNEKTRDNERAVIGAVKAAQDHAAAVTAQTGSVARGNTVFAGHVTQLRRVLERAGLSRAEIDRLIRTYARVPKNVTTNVTVNDRASGALRSIIRLRDEAGRAVAIQVGIGAGRVIGEAHGGIIGAATGGVHGGLRMVGEAGRELVRLPYGSTVVPHGQTEAMMGGSGGGGEMHIHLRIGDEELGEVILDPLRKVVRHRGGLTATFQN
jgi:hypothetical protein